MRTHLVDEGDDTKNEVMKLLREMDLFSGMSVNVRRSGRASELVCD